MAAASSSLIPASVAGAEIKISGTIWGISPPSRCECVLLKRVYTLTEAPPIARHALCGAAGTDVYVLTGPYGQAVNEFMASQPDQLLCLLASEIY